VGPIWHGGDRNEAELLSSAYRESLKLAADRNLTSISFASISTGAYGYPLDKAARVALRAVTSFLKEKNTSVKEVFFVLFDSRTYESYCAALKELILKVA
jgi:O-acetyl-ADP-ribose deacetylase (regulator of RNase III)